MEKLTKIENLTKIEILNKRKFEIFKDTCESMSSKWLLLTGLQSNGRARKGKKRIRRRNVTSRVCCILQQLKRRKTIAAIDGCAAGKEIPSSS